MPQQPSLFSSTRPPLERPPPPPLCPVEREVAREHPDFSSVDRGETQVVQETLLSDRVPPRRWCNQKEAVPWRQGCAFEEARQQRGQGQTIFFARRSFGSQQDEVAQGEEEEWLGQEEEGRLTAINPYQVCCCCRPTVAGFHHGRERQRLFGSWNAPPGDAASRQQQRADVHPYTDQSPAIHLGSPGAGYRWRRGGLEHGHGLAGPEKHHLQQEVLVRELRYQEGKG